MKPTYDLLGNILPKVKSTQIIYWVHSLAALNCSNKTPLSFETESKPDHAISISENMKLVLNCHKSRTNCLKNKSVFEHYLNNNLFSLWIRMCERRFDCRLQRYVYLKWTPISSLYSPISSLKKTNFNVTLFSATYEFFFLFMSFVQCRAPAS